MIEFRRTSSMEQTALKLDSAYDRVMIRAACILHPPIRLRAGMLNPVRPFILRNDPAFDREIKAWQKQDGTLINNRKYARGEPVLRHQASLLCECPMSWDAVEAMSRDSSELCVIYKPPSWRVHESFLYAAWPTGSECKRFAEALEPHRICRMIEGKLFYETQPQCDIADALGIPREGAYATTDDGLCATLKIDYDQLHILRKRTMRVVDERKKYSHRFSIVMQLIPRIEPEDLTLLPMYRAITELPAAGHIRLARDNVLASVHRFWKTSLRSLVRSGCVERKPTLGYYFFDGPQPDYERIQAEHVSAKGKFNRLVERVESLPEYR